MNLTHRQFEILIAATDAGSFSAAALALGISQPSLSESIRRIETELGTRLFERTTRSLRLTEDGRFAASVAREAVRDFRRALDRLASRGGGRQGRIAIAALPSVASAALPEAIGEFSRAHPGIAVALHDVQHERAVALVTEGVADFAVTIKPAQQDALVFDEIGADSAHLVCRKDHPLVRKSSVRWRDLLGQPFIGITRISSVRRLTDAAFVHAETAIEPRYEVEQIPSAVALVEAGLGVTALPSLTFAMFRGRDLATRPLIAPRLRRNVGFVTLAERAMPEVAAALMQELRKTLARHLRTGSARR
jgi:LysR family carnitine catabolism transcriptional activator